MKQFFTKPLYVFFLLFVVLSIAFCCFPINIFDGEIVYQQGISVLKEMRPLSLHFVLGLEYSKSELANIMPGYTVKDYYLLPKGYAMAFIFIVGIPALLAYRVHLGNKRNDKKSA